jgi:hypothetical protein
LARPASVNGGFGDVRRSESTQTRLLPLAWPMTAFWNTKLVVTAAINDRSALDSGQSQPARLRISIFVSSVSFPRG